MSDHCDESLAQLYTYLDGELDRESVERIKAHLEDCPPCGGAFSFEQRLKVVVRQHLQEEIPPVFLERLRTVIRAEGIVGT